MSKNKSTEKFTLTDPIQFLALGFGSGLAPKAPGTFGTLSAVPIFLLMSALTPLYYAVIVTLMAVAGIYICQKAADAAGVHDHGAIVWDEIVGFLITMFMVPLSWQSILVGFALFRFFDILKPWPISFIDKKVHGGFGIMLDDVLAGFFALIIMQFLF
jgi:phosphatidylglycerophosphatase A